MEQTPPPPQSTLAESQHQASHKQTVKNGRGWILGVAILQFITGAVFFAISRGSESPEAAQGLVLTSIVVGLLGVIFLGLWFWAKYAPFAAALCALALYISFISLDAIADPRLLFRGIILKILIIAGLSQAVKSGYALKKNTEAGT